MATILSLVFKSEASLIGNMPKNTIGMGFPFHFYEAIYRSNIYNNPISHKLLLLRLLGNILIYLCVVISVWYLILKWLKGYNWRPLFIAVGIGIVSLIVNVSASDSCGAGFPVEFYPKCTGGVSVALKIILSGLFFDTLFWIGLSMILVAGLHKFFSFRQLKRFLIHKDIWLTIISAWVTIIVMSLLSSIVRLKEFAGAAVFAVVIAPFLPKMHHYFKRQQTETVKKFFFSKVGYITLGISVGLILISFSFNLFYESGWFDFTDFGFVLLSYPLNMIIRFQFNSDVFSKRIILYLISLANLSIIILVLDIFGFLCIKTYRVVQKMITGK